MNFLTAVLSVKLNRKRVAVCLKTALHVFDISDMKCLRTLETAPNPDGVMALSPNEENCHLAFPDGAKAGGAGGGGEVGSVFRRWRERVATAVVCAAGGVVVTVHVWMVPALSPMGATPAMSNAGPSRPFSRGGGGSQRGGMTF